MSYYFSANNQYLTRTTGGFFAPRGSSGLVWAKLLVDTNASSAIYGTISGGAEYMYLYNLSGDGQTFALEFGNGVGAALVGPTMTLGTWYSFAWSYAAAGGSATLYYRTAEQPAWTAVASVGLAQIAYTITQEIIGANTFSLTTSTFPGSIAGLRTWNSVLSADQLLRESFSPTPLIRPYSWYPMDRMMTRADASGNGRTMTPTGAFTLADNPLPFQPVRRRWLYGDKGTVVAGKAMPVFGALYRPQLRRQRVVYSQ